MTNYYQKDTEYLIKYIHIYIADIFIEYEKQTGHIPENIVLYNEKIRKSLEGEQFTNWLVGRGIHYNNIKDTELFKYILNQMDNPQIYSACLSNNTSLSELQPCDIINTFARYDAELSLIIKDDN